MALSESEELDLLELEKEKAEADARAKTGTKPSESFGQTVKNSLAQVASPFTGFVQMNKDLANDPAKVIRSPLIQAGLPLGGGAIGGPIGAAGGEFIRQGLGAAMAPETVPESALGRFGGVVGQGVMQEPKILNAIPGVPQIGEMISGLASKVGSKTGRFAAKAGQFLGGAREGDLREAAKKGYSATYGALSKEEAGNMMGQAIDKLPGKSVAPTMVEMIESAVTPESSSGSKFLKDLGQRIDEGELPDARQALKAKQALDDVIDTVPIWQTKRRAKLFDIKRTFDDVLSSQSGELKAASNEYRAAALKDNLNKPLPVNKHGEYSRLAGLLSTMGGSAGAAIGGHQSGVKGGILGGLAPLASAVALSPASLGRIAAGGGSAGALISEAASNPVVRQAIVSMLQKVAQKKK